MASRDVVVVGASAGGVEALRDLVSRLPADYPAALLVVLHVPPAGRSALPDILTRAGRLPARHATDGDVLTPGQILVAPPNRHLIVYDSAVTLSPGPRENGHRPAIDVLFRTAARALGPRVMAVILSGALDDGTAGGVAVKLRGGTCLAQDPEEALHPSMPRSAIHAGCVDIVGTLSEIAEALIDLAGQPAPEVAPPVSPLMNLEAVMADLDPRGFGDHEHPGVPAAFSCPDCQGTLYQINEGGLVRFRCRVGHAWSVESLLAQQSSAYESALWMAMRSLEEKASLSRNLAVRARERGNVLSAESFENQVAETLHAAELVREVIDKVSAGARMEVDGGTHEKGRAPVEP
jgi:two-component system chemotaxis response regulator CheB